MQNTVGKHCCQETHKKLEDREILPANQGSSDQENAATSTYDVLYEDSKRTNSDCSNKSRVQFKLLMDLLVQYRVGLTLTWWVAGALLERTVVMQLGNCNSAPHQLTMGQPQGSLLLLILYNVYTKALTDLNQNGHTQPCSQAEPNQVQLMPVPGHKCKSNALHSA